MVWENLTPSRLLTRASFDNALVAYMALGGSTNAAVHLIALARRARVALALADMDASRASRRCPPIPTERRRADGRLLVRRRPARAAFAAADRLALDALTVNGRTLGENLAGTTVWNEDVIRPLERPVTGDPAVRGALAVLTGNLAPRGAVIKPSAATPELLTHRGPALVFDDHAELSARIDDPDLPSPGTPCWYCATPARWVRPGCRNGATCRYPGSC